jgi:ankyrin repeat protein
MVRPRAAEPLLSAIAAQDGAAVQEWMNADPWGRQHAGPSGESLVLYACYMAATALAPILRGDRPYDACEAAALGDLGALNDALDRDADLISWRSGDGWTPLHLAAFFGRDQCAAYLIDNSAPLDAFSTNALRNTPLHAALAGVTNQTLVRRLIFAGADVGTRAEGAVQPIHLAASRGDQGLCDLLIGRGADPMARTDAGETAADLARSRGFPELADKLAAYPDPA